LAIWSSRFRILVSHRIAPAFPEGRSPSNFQLAETVPISFPFQTGTTGLLKKRVPARKSRNMTAVCETIRGGSDSQIAITATKLAAKEEAGGGNLREARHQRVHYQGDGLSMSGWHVLS
jgi:hypothetical protein